MAMSPRLLRPRATGYDPAAQVYFNAVALADGQQLEPAVKKAINDFVKGCKADGIWSAIKASCILMGARTLSGALTPLVGTAPTNSNFVSGDYDRKTGLAGDAVNKSLNSNRAVNADGQNDSHVGIYVHTADNGVNRSYFRTGVKLAVADGTNVASGINFTSLATHAGLAALSFFGLSRSSSANYTRRLNGASATVTDTSTAPGATPLVFYVRYETGTQYSAARLAYYSMGGALDLALLDTRVSALYTAIGAAIP